MKIFFNSIIFFLLSNTVFSAVLATSSNLREFENRVNPNSSALQKELFTAVQQLSIKAIHTAVQRGALVTQVDSHGCTALILLCHSDFKANSKKRIQTAKKLLELGARANINQKYHGETALHRAAGYGDVMMVTLLLTNGADPSLLTDETEDEDPATAEELARESGHEELANFIAKRIEAAAQIIR